jgi:anti-anti-sigma factor
MSQGNQGNQATQDAATQASSFALESERQNGSHRVRLQGEMDLSVIGLVDREMRRAEASDAAKIVLDLDELEFVDAAGLRLLLQLNTRSEDNGRRLRVRRAAAPQVQRVLELTGVGSQLPFED